MNLPDNTSRKSRDNSPYFAFYILLLVAQIVLVWILPYFPTQDGPSHVYNLAILHDLLHGGKEWGAYFTYDLKATPNLGFNLITYPLLSIASPLIAEKIFLTVYIILMGVAVHLLLTTFAPSGFKAIKLLAIPVMYNFTLMMGFYSYAIAVPLFLLAISMAWRMRTSPPLLKYVFIYLAGIIIFYLHLIPFIYYLITLAIFVVVETRIYAGSIRSAVYRFTLLLPLPAMLFYYLHSSTVSKLPADISYLMSGNRALSLFADLLTFSMITHSPWQLLPAVVTMAVAILLLSSLLKGLVRRTIRPTSEQMALLLLTVVLTSIYFVAPARFGEGSFFNNRIPWVILLILLPTLACVSAHARPVIRYGIVVAAVLSISCNVVVFRQQAKDVEAFLVGLNAGCSKGEGILLYRTSWTAWPQVDVLLHASSYYGIVNKCVDLGNYEATVPFFPVRFRSNVGAVPHEVAFAYGVERIDFSRYLAIRRILGWDLKPEDRERLGELFTCSLNNGKLSIWNRR